MFEVKADEAWDIDEEIDFKIVDLLMSRPSVQNGDH
jgi:CMP-N-acetylneuraminic acid synthetase